MTKLDLTKPLMPKAVAQWLIDETGLTFEQISDFTGLHMIEIQALADEEVGRGIMPQNPIETGELTEAELKRCEADPRTRLKINRRSDLPAPKIRAKGPRYTPVAKRQDKPDAIAYILKQNPEISEARIVKLVGTTKNTIKMIREKTHPNMSNLKPRHPADIGLCTYAEYEAAIRKGLKALGRDPDAEAAARAAQQAEEDRLAQEAAQQQQQSSGSGGFDFSNFYNPNKATGSDNN
ncbi:MAG: DUF1013 domain-containing protein [Alphaproteobacteria bacterium]|nr:DUF1013 domain-containing protein [Alphaproteobacteria bacterium]